MCANGDRALLEKVAAGFETIGELYNGVKLRAALSEVLGLAREANGYIFATLPSLCSGQAVHAWVKSELPAGQALREPAPLFKKLDESVLPKGEETARLAG